MKTIPAILLLVVLGTGCATQAQNGAMYGATAGATIDALTSKNKVSGAAMGAAGGLLIGFIVGNEIDKQHYSDAKFVEKQPTGVPIIFKEPDGSTTSITFRSLKKDRYTMSREAAVRNSVDNIPFYMKGHKTADGTWIFQEDN